MWHSRREGLLTTCGSLMPACPALPQMLGKTLQGIPRGDVVIATKVSDSMLMKQAVRMCCESPPG